MRPEALESRCLLVGDPIISKFVASNDNSLLDGNGSSSDWIEIFNNENESVNLEGWYLTNDANNLKKWQCPNPVLSVNEYQIVFASGNEELDAESTLHTNFKLNASAELLALVKPDGVSVDGQVGSDGR